MSPRRFEIEAFVEACHAEVANGEGERAVRELLLEATSDLAVVLAALGERAHAGPVVLHRSTELTVLDFAWAPWMCFKPHNHNMWSVVALLAGREDNVFWRRCPGSIEAAGARSLGAGDVTVLGHDVIHSVTNPVGKMTRAIHVYGGDFFAPLTPRSEWEPETLTERPWDMDDTHRRFAEAEARARLDLASRDTPP